MTFSLSSTVYLSVSLSHVWITSRFCIILDALNVNATNDLLSELSILLKIKPHLNICNLLGFCNDESQYCMVVYIIVLACIYFLQLSHCILYWSIACLEY